VQGVDAVAIKESAIVAAGELVMGRRYHLFPVVLAFALFS